MKERRRRKHSQEQRKTSEETREKSEGDDEEEIWENIRERETMTKKKKWKDRERKGEVTEKKKFHLIEETESECLKIQEKDYLSKNEFKFNIIGSVGSPMVIHSLR